jgi:hypothetical protein
LNREGEIYKRALDLMHSGQLLGQIAQIISEEFPQRFGTAEEALAFVGDLSVRLCA